MDATANQQFFVGTVDDIPARGARRLRIGSQDIAIFRTSDDRVFAIADQCPHKQGPLSQGIVHDVCVTCPLHNWVINLETGYAQGADEGVVETFAISKRDRALYLSVPVSSATAGD